MKNKTLLLVMLASILIIVPFVHADAPSFDPSFDVGYDLQAAHAVSEGAYFWVQVTNRFPSGLDQFKIVLNPAFNLLFSIYVPYFSEYTARLVSIPFQHWSTESSWVFAEFSLYQGEKMLFLFSAPNIEGNYSVYHFLFYKNDSGNIDFPVCVMSLNYTQAIENVLTQEDLAKARLSKQIDFQDIQIQLMEKMFNFSWSDYANDPSGYVNSLQHQLNETAYWKDAFSEKEMKLNLVLGVFGLGLVFFRILVIKTSEKRRKQEETD